MRFEPPGPLRTSSPVQPFELSRPPARKPGFWGAGSCLRACTVGAQIERALPVLWATELEHPIRPLQFLRFGNAVLTAFRPN
jgi:hypothetical protein